MQSLLADSIDDINKFIETPLVILEHGVHKDKSVTFDVCGGADQAGLHSALGLAGCNSSHPCGQCECLKEELCSTDLKHLASIQRRDIPRLQRLAHLSEGLCPGCKMMIVKKDDLIDPKAQVVLAEEGDDEPNLTAAQKRKLGTTSWKVAHFGKMYARSVLMKVDPFLWAICILHLHLRFVGMLLAKTVLARLDQYRKNGKKDAHAAISLRVWELMVAVGIPVRRLRTPSNDLDTHFSSISKHSFAGFDCAAMMLIWPVILDLVYPKEERTDTNDASSYRKAFQCWEHYQKNIWSELNTKPETEEAKIKKAETIEAAAVKFVDLWARAVGTTEHLYIHLLVAHVPDQIKSLPADIWYLQIQGLEHAHKIRKSWARNLSNCHKRRSTHHVPAKLAKDGTVLRKAFNRNSGTTLVTQMMRQSVLEGDRRGYRALVFDEAYINSLMEDAANGTISSEIIDAARVNLEEKVSAKREGALLALRKLALKEESSKRSVERGVMNAMSDAGYDGDGEGDDGGDGGDGGDGNKGMPTVWGYKSKHVY